MITLQISLAAMKRSIQQKAMHNKIMEKVNVHVLFLGDHYNHPWLDVSS